MTEESKKSIGQLMEMIEEKPEYRKFIRPKHGLEWYGLSRYRFVRMALVAGALIKINSTLLIEVEVFERYFNGLKEFYIA